MCSFRVEKRLLAICINLDVCWEEENELFKDFHLEDY